MAWWGSLHLIALHFIALHFITLPGVAGILGGPVHSKMTMYYGVVMHVFLVMVAYLFIRSPKTGRWQRWGTWYPSTYPCFGGELTNYTGRRLCQVSFLTDIRRRHGKPAPQAIQHVFSSPVPFLATVPSGPEGLFVLRSLSKSWKRDP
jgi:hypothetical protein